MVRGEIPNEFGASWISPKCVEAQRLKNFFKKDLCLGVKLCFDAGYESGTNSR